nr:hypothetical protein BaRGS_020367 [Batillaria attramentaria]
MVKHYRFSIAWSRLIPDPTTGVVNPAAVAYYLSLLTALREERIQPMVTLFHWDLPQILEDNGSWGNDSIIDYFKQYADAAFSRFGGTYDYFGLNHYSTSLCEPTDDVYQASVTQGYIGDMEVKLSRDPSWRKAASYYLFYVPWGMRGILNWIRTHYNNPPTIVTENGVTDNNGTLQDSHRIDYLRSYIDEMIKATLIDKCNVVGYTVWSIMDNFEWARGYTEKFGIYYVDFDDPQRPRVAKDSAHFYKQVIADRGFPDPGLVG